jgi:hypothetical protein
LCWFFNLKYYAERVSIRLGILLAIIAALYIAARVTGILQFYIIPTIANEPNIRLKEKLFTTNLKSAQPYQFIVFTSRVQDLINASFIPNFKEGSHYLYHLCRIAGGVIEIKSYVLFVRNKNFNEELNLKNQYKISKKNYLKIDEKDIAIKDFKSSIIQTGDYNIFLFEQTL